MGEEAQQRRGEQKDYKTRMGGSSILADLIEQRISSLGERSPIDTLEEARRVGDAGSLLTRGGVGDRRQAVAGAGRGQEAA